MPNLVPPLTEVKDILAYRTRLQALEPNVEFLMSLYLTSSTTTETIIEAKKAGITGVKSVRDFFTLFVYQKAITGQC